MASKRSARRAGAPGSDATHRARAPSGPGPTGAQCCSISSRVVLPQSPQLERGDEEPLVPAPIDRATELDRDDVVLLLALAREAVRDRCQVGGRAHQPLGDAEADRELEVVARACAS